MGAFAVPAQAPKSSAIIETFRGVDLNNSPANVDPSRSPAAPNMVRDQIGKVRKRMGYTTVATAPGRIYGVHRLGEETLIHAGAKLYRWDGAETFTELGAMAETRSRSFSYDKKLYLLDGVTYQVYDGQTLKAVSQEAYVPTIIINRKPNGGGTPYESLNLLGTKWKESFLSDGKATVYNLTTKDIDADVVVETLNSEGGWDPMAKNKYTVQTGKGTVTFKAAVPESPVKGADNVHITAKKVREGYADKINHCTVFATYGVGGAADRIFMSGNRDLPGQDFYSDFDEPAYFPDTQYTNLSRDGSEVAGYAILNNALATFLKGSTDGRNVIIRTGSLDPDGEALFRISNTLLGESPAATHSFALSGKEPLFLTDQGIYAITAEDLTGEKYSQERSYYIKTALQDIPDKEKCFATIYRDFYVLSTGTDLYLMDLQQRTFEKNSPYSSFQYECYYWPGIPAEVLWTEGEALWFGTADGRLCKFATNVDDPRSYNDDGKAINAYWETSDFDGKSFYKTKTFTSVSCRLAAAPLTGVKIFAQVQGAWRQVFDARERARYLTWEYIDFAKFVFSADRTPRTLWGKVKLKKVDKTRFRLQNKELDEPFGIYAFGTEWREPGNNYKR